jgi:hypothetical protein
MALNYLGLDVRDTRAPASAPEAPKPARGKFVLLLLVNIVVLVFAGRAFLNWKGAEIAKAIGMENTSVSKVLTAKGVISGILHNDDNPAVIIDGQVLHEGDIFGDYKIVKIHPDRVDIESHGRNITRAVGQ